MFRRSIIGTLLTLLMFLLVSISAVVFLLQNRSDLQETVTRQAADAAGLQATRDQLSSDLSVVQAAYTAAEATRQALGTQVDGQATTVASLEGVVTRQVVALERANEQWEAAATRVFIFSPRDGAVLAAGSAVDIFVAATAEAGLSRIEVTVGDEPPQTFPAEELEEFPVRVEWRPAAAGAVVISAVAVDLRGRESAPATVNVTVAAANTTTELSPAAQGVADQIVAAAPAATLSLPRLSLTLALEPAALVDVALGDWAVLSDDQPAADTIFLRLSWKDRAAAEAFARAYAGLLDSRFGHSGRLAAAGAHCWRLDNVTCLYQSAADNLIVRAPEWIAAGY
jgi:hypothetical protein